MVRKLLMWGGIAFLIIFITTRPQVAAGVFKSVGIGSMGIFTGFGDFLSNLVT